MTIFCIVPGETDVEVPMSDPARWQARCACGETHPITHTQYWNVDEDGKPDPALTDHWCFVCPKDGIHYQLEGRPPYRILKVVQYRPTAKIVAAEELDGDELADSFE